MQGTADDNRGEQSNTFLNVEATEETDLQNVHDMGREVEINEGELISARQAQLMTP